jgi:hypothetical protein
MVSYCTAEEEVHLRQVIPPYLAPEGWLTVSFSTVSAPSPTVRCHNFLMLLVRLRADSFDNAICHQKIKLSTDLNLNDLVHFIPFATR